MILIVMGVSASGKSTVGQQLAQTLGWTFLEGDDFHPPANVDKMSQGEPLNDRDRWPWLDAIRQTMATLQRQDTSAVITCSALKQSYRDYLRQPATVEAQFVYLKSSPQTLQTRLEQRQGHFMKAAMLESQLATLEEPQAAIVVEVDNSTPPEQVVQAICAQLTENCQPQSANDEGDHDGSQPLE